MGFNLGELIFKMSADVASLRTDMAEAKKAVNEASEGIKRGADVAREALQLLGIAFTVDAAVEWVKTSVEVADQANKTAQKIGLSTEALTGFQYAAKLADVDSEALQTSLVRLSKNMAAAAAGSGAQSAAFAQLGITTQDANGKLRSVDSVLLDVAERFAAMEDGAQKAALAQEIFGKTGANLIPFLNQGRDGIEQLRAEAEKLGVVIKGDTAKAAEEFNDNLTRVKAASSGAANALLAEMLPALNRISGAMVDAAKEGGVLHALFIGLGGVAKEAFSRDNYTDIELAKAQIKDLTKEIEISKLALQGYGYHAIGPAEELRAKVEQLQHQLELATWWQDKLLNPPREAPKLKLEAPDMSGVIEYAQAIADADKTLIDQSIKAAQDVQREIEQIMQSIMRAEGATEQAIDRLAEKSSNDFFKTDKFKDQTKGSLEQIGADPEGDLKRQQALNAQLETEELRHQAALGNSEAQWELKRRQFSEMSAKLKTKTVLGELTTLSAGIAQHNRAAFEVNKAASIASAVVSTYEMAVGSYKAMASIPYVGPVLGVAAAAAAVAFGMAQVSAIQSTSFTGGGGGTTPSAAGSGSVVNGIPTASSSGATSLPTAQQNPTAPTINFYGDIHSNDAERLMKDIKSLISDADFVLIDTNSRQAAELRAA